MRLAVRVWRGVKGFAKARVWWAFGCRILSKAWVCDLGTFERGTSKAEDGRRRRSGGGGEAFMLKGDD